MYALQRLRGSRSQLSKKFKVRGNTPSSVGRKAQANSDWFAKLQALSSYKEAARDNDQAKAKKSYSLQTTYFCCCHSFLRDFKMSGQKHW